ncbi:MAG: type IV secretory system conjugative DNA transfer family protein [Eubacteriales bacterium]|nr:type IV secretory system conjugative DNA transfer family protein [Eubacteriales bacterium]
MDNRYSYEADWRPFAFPKDEAHLATREELCEKYTTVILEKGAEIEKGGMPVLSDGHCAAINCENEMTIIYGTTGTKKTRVLISVLIAILALSGESMIIPDVKGELSTGELSAKIRGVLNDRGYVIRTLNFRTLDGDGFDILKSPYRLYRSGNKESAMMQLHSLIDQLSAFYRGHSFDPIWIKLASQFLMAVAVHLFELCDDPAKINLLSLATYTTRESCMHLERIMQLNEHRNNITTMLSSVLSEPDKTKMSTLATASSLFGDLIINRKLLRMLSTSTFQLDELYEKKTALFLILPDENDAYGPVAGLILSQISTFLVEKAYEKGGKLPKRVNYVCDEFCNYYIPGMGTNISAHRSRNIRWYLVCQSRKQLMRTYPDEYGAITGNCTNIYFMGSPDTDLLEELSEHAGYTNISEDGTPRKLISAADLRKIKKGREYSEVYFSSGALTCVTQLPDIDQYAFLTEYTERVPLPVHSHPDVPVYSSAQMLQDMQKIRIAYQKKRTCRSGLSREEEELAERYEKLFE